MAYAPKIVLHCSTSFARGSSGLRLEELVEAFIQSDVKVVAVVGADAELIEDCIDKIVVGDGSRDYDLLTSAHPTDSVEDAIEFVTLLTLEFEGLSVQVVEL